MKLSLVVMNYSDQEWRRLFLFESLNEISPCISAEFHYNYHFIAALQEEDITHCLGTHCSLRQTNKNEI